MICIKRYAIWSHDHVTWPCHITIWYTILPIWYAFLENKHTGWLEFMWHSRHLYVSFQLFRHQFISLEVKSIMSPWHKKKTKMFERCMRPDHTCWDHSHIILDLQSHVMLLLYQAVWSRLIHHSTTSLV